MRLSKLPKQLLLTNQHLVYMIVGIPILILHSPFFAIVVGALTGIMTISIKMKLGYKIEQDEKIGKKKEKDSNNNGCLNIGT